MHGNVQEWCSDWYCDWYYRRSPKEDPECKEGERVYRCVRGGSWFSEPVACRAACRSRHEPEFASSRIGFRVVFCTE